MKNLLVMTLVCVILFTSENIAAQYAPPMGLSEAQSISLFMDAVRSDDFDMAVQFGEWVLVAATKSIEGLERYSLTRHYERMINVYTGLAERESDPSLSSEYYNKALAVFELAFEVFDEGELDLYEWNLNMGRYLHENSSALNVRTRDIANRYEKAYELDQDRFIAESNGFFVEIILNHYVSAGQREEAFALIDRVEETASAEMISRMNDVRKSLFETPQERIDFYQSLLENSEDIDEREILFQQLLDLYDEIGDSNKVIEIAYKLYEINPNFLNTNRLSEFYLADGNYVEATDYLKEAFNMATSEAERKEVALELASAYQQLLEFREASRFVKEALRIDQNYGPAYMRMASIYAGSVSHCAGGNALERDDRTVYWLVIDYLEKARQVDSSLSNRVTNQMNLYKSAMPTVNDKFFRGWEVGDSFRINASIGECYAWIDETTTIK